MNKKIIHYILMVLLCTSFLIKAECGSSESGTENTDTTQNNNDGIDDDTNTDGDGTTGDETTEYTVGGTISGLKSGGLELTLNGSDVVSPENGDTNFTFTETTTGLYEVVITAQPALTDCVITNASGTAMADVTDISIECTAQTFFIGGTINWNSKTTTSDMIITLNGSEQIELNESNTTFQFVTKTVPYSVVVTTQPTTAEVAGIYCSLLNGSGEATADVSTISISCYDD